MPGDTRQNIDTGTLVHIQPDLACTQFDRCINGQRERRATKFHRINAQKKVMHHRIADQHNLDDIISSKPSLFSRTGDQFLQPFNDRAGHFQMPARIHDAVRHTAHQILTKANLRIHRAGRRQHIACHHVTQMR